MGRGNTKVGVSGYYGVRWHDVAKKWAVQIATGKGKVKYLGLYESKTHAAAAYDKVARKMKKELLNFPVNQPLEAFLKPKR